MIFNQFTAGVFFQMFKELNYGRNEEFVQVGLFLSLNFVLYMLFTDKIKSI